jgi:hypothetical protein
MFEVLLLAAETCDPATEVCRSSGEGPGLWLRLFLVVSFLGIIATAWFILRGYREGNDRRDQ